jgi:hypothetical protein
LQGVLEYVANLTGIVMQAKLEPLILDLVEWIGKFPRPYMDVMEAWRTSCPRLTVWEDAVDRGYLVRERANGSVIVRITSQGREYLRQHGRDLEVTTSHKTP